MWILRVFLLSCLLSPFFAFSQKGTVSFGIQYRPLIPNVVFDGDPLELTNDTLSAKVSTQVGHSFGFLIRTNFSERWSLETGINQTRRNYVLNAESFTQPVEERFTISMLTYEIPVQALYYVRLTNRLYMNALAGGSFNFYPTIQHIANSDELNFAVSTKRWRWRGLSLLSNVGFEYRTENAGYFYLGASLHRPLENIAYMEVVFRTNGVNSPAATSNISGNFLTFDLRYFFPAEKKSINQDKPSDK